MGLMRLFRAWLAEGPDAELVKLKQTPRYTFTGYDEAKAHAGYLKAQRHTETGRPLPQPTRERVVSFRREAQ